MAKIRHYKNGFWQSRVGLVAIVQIGKHPECDLSEQIAGMDGWQFVSRIEYNKSFRLHVQDRHVPYGPYMIPVLGSKDQYQREQEKYLRENPKKYYDGSFYTPDPYLSKYEAMFVKIYEPGDEVQVYSRNKQLGNPKRKLEL